MAELNEKILKAIQEDLPSATAGELKKFIEEANATKAALVTEKKAKEELESKLTALKEKETTYNTATTKLKEADGKLAFVEKRSFEIERELLEERLEQRNFVINKFDNFLSLLVKNPRAIELTSETRNVPVFEPYAGGGGHHSTQTEYTSGTKETTETKD